MEVYEPLTLNTESLSEEAIQEIGYRLRDFTATLVYNLIDSKHRRVCQTVQTLEIGESSLHTARTALHRVCKGFAKTINLLFSENRWARKEGEKRVLLTWNCHSAEELLTESSTDESAESAPKRLARRNSNAIR
jgi:hypothetical protein